MGKKIRSLFIFAILTVLIPTNVQSSMPQEQPQTASWYSIKSCLAEGSSGIMANGRRLRDEGVYTAAMWDQPFGSRVLVRNLANGREVICTITDRGPAKRLVRKGRIIDLNRAAFAAIADLRKGVINVKVTRIGRK